MPFRYSPLWVPLAAAALFLCSGCSDSEPLPTIQFTAGTFSSADKCGRCHTGIHSAWSQSQHARAFTDPLFQASMSEAVEAGGDQAKALCLACHAPTTVVTKDTAETDPITREGITCDFCHSVTGTDLEKEGHPFILEVSDVKHGPVQNAASVGHKVLYSEFFTQSEMCAGCHQYSTPQGLALLKTYAEWQNYVSKGGEKTCQQCHMPLTATMIVDPKIKRDAGAFVNLHSIPGGHSMDQLSKSVRLRIVEIVPTRNGIRVRVEVANVGAGHNVPTGSPTRKVILNLDVSTGTGRQLHQERIYERVVKNQAGEELRKDSRAFLEAASEERDTRLQPLEKRTEEFSVDVPSGENVTVKATLSYFYSPLDEQATEQRVDFASDEQKLRAAFQRGAAGGH